MCPANRYHGWAIDRSKDGADYQDKPQRIATIAPSLNAFPIVPGFGNGSNAAPAGKENCDQYGPFSGHMNGEKSIRVWREYNMSTAMTGTSSLHSRTIAELVSRIADRLDDQSLILALLYFSDLDGSSYDFSSLAAALGRPRATVRRGLEPLLTAGCIETQADPADRRRTTLRLSPVGRRQAQRYLDQLSGVILPILERRDRAKPRRALPRRTQAIGLDHATPLIRKVFEWAKTEPSSVPLQLMDRLFIVEPDRGNFANSTFRHWGSGVWRQIDGEIPAPKKVGDAISRQSLDFYRLTLDQYDQARNAPSMHVVEVEVILPDGTRHYDIYQRIAIYHPTVGIISCPDFISWSPRKSLP